ncbi:MAG: HEAT repeat domain-containing protein [Bacteroidia bacterium]|nr:HEAT repeat domain-containing protein [Bacteroidia bacterium]
MKKRYFSLFLSFLGVFHAYSQVSDQEFKSYQPPLVSAENFIFSNSEFKWQPKTSLVFLNYAKLSGAFTYQLDAFSINSKFYTVGMSTIFENSDPTYKEANYYLLPFGVKVPLFNTQKATLTLGSNFYLFPMNNSANANNEGMDFKFPTFIDNQLKLEANYFFGISALVGYRVQLSQYTVNNTTTNRIIYTGIPVSGLYAGISCNLEVFLPIMNPHAYGKCYNQGREDWFAARNANTEAAYDDFMARYTPSPYSDDVYDRKEYLIYKKAWNGAISDCDYYLSNYKTGKYTKKVLLKKEEKYAALIKQALENKDAEARLDAVNQIDDEEVLAKVVLKENDNTVRARAFGKIQEQRLLKEIAMNANDASIRVSAIMKLNDQDILTKIATADPNSSVRAAAVDKVRDEGVLLSIVLKDTDLTVRKTAATHIKDPLKLSTILSESEDVEVCEIAISNIKIDSHLTQIALTNRNPDLRLAAAQKIYSQSELGKIALQSTDKDVLEKVISKLKDQDVLTNLAIKKTTYELASYAVSRIENQSDFKKVALGAVLWDIRKEAFFRLNDETLEEIIQSEKESAIVLASKIRLGKATWEKAFQNSSTKIGLSNVIGAAALVDSPQPTSDDIVDACHRYIRQGNASRIPELKVLLLRFGDVTLAEDYLNCGNAQLYDAAETWGSENGYNIGPGNGSTRVQWGGGN